MATPSVLKRLGDKASSYWSSAKSILPDENENKALAEKQNQVNEATEKAHVEKPAPEKPVSSIDNVNSLARYGDRPGEKRLSVDIDGNIATEAAQPTQKPGLKPIPVYDNGGDVDGEDGNHQVAILEKGEKVLTPEQAAEYRAEHGEERGAPADFGGRVLSNPKGLKPMRDTENSAQADEPNQGNMSVDNAPLETPPGSITNPTATHPGGKELANTSGAVVQDVDSKKTLRPYSEVMSERAEKEKAKEKVNNPGMRTLDSDSTETEIKPRGGTPEEQRAVDTDIRNAMGKGVNGLTQLGLAKIHEKLLPPPGFNGGDNAPDETAQPTQPAGPGLKPITAAPAPEMDHKARVADYNKRIQAALDKGTPEGQEEADRLALAKQEFIHSTPWGTPGNHPGFLGKLGHVAEHVAARLPIIGQVMGAIPGTEASRNAEHNTTLAQMKADTPLTTAREAEENSAEKNANKLTTAPNLHELNGGAVDPQHPELGRQQALYNEKTGEIQYKGPAAEKPVTGQENKDAFQKVLAKIGTPEAADPGKQLEAIKAAHDAKTITDKEYNDSIGYLGANPAPATQMTASTEKADAAAKAKRAGKWFTWADDEGVHYGSGDKVPEGAEPTEVDGKTFLNEARAGNIVQKSLNQIAKDVDEHPELFDNVTARNIIATTLDQVDRTSAGLLIAGTGGTIPLPSGIGEMINTALQNNALDKKTAEAVKDYIADYKSMKDKVIVMQMEMQGGKIGRGSAQAFKAIADQIPNGATADSKTAQRQVKNLFTTQDDLMSKFPDKYQTYTKEKPYTPIEHVEAPHGAESEVIKDGKVIGHVLVENGKRKYVPLPQKTVE